MYMLRYILELFTPHLVPLKRSKAIWHLILCESCVVIILYSCFSYPRLKTCGEEFLVGEEAPGFFTCLTASWPTSLKSHVLRLLPPKITSQKYDR
jgi:hypothetical protein